jgi:UDP-N-acetylglucosamine 4-epimerase
MYDIKYHNKDLSNFSFLVTGGAGFIGSNLVEYLLKYGAKKVRVLDDLSTGFQENIDLFIDNPAFEFIKGDIRNLEDCQKACEGMDYVSHQAALGSVPRSINDPITTNAVNISGFLNMLVAVRDQKVKRIVYAASSSTYGDSKELPKVEDRIGKPLSPYAVTKYVNELYADVFAKAYGIETIGLRYFNVFGPRQSPDGAYAAVIPKFILHLLKHESPIINGTGEYSRDFTFIENVVQMNMLALFVSNSEAINNIYNTAVGDRTTLNELVTYIKLILLEFNQRVSDVSVIYGPNRGGDIPHSLASINKAEKVLGYRPTLAILEGLRETVKYFIRFL